MMHKRDIAKLARKLLQKQRGYKDHQIIHPQREWVIGLCFGLLLLAAGASWNVISYQAISERNLDTVTPAEISPAVYREEVVQAALAEFRSRSERYDTLLEASIPVEVSEELLESPDDSIILEIDTEAPSSVAASSSLDQSLDQESRDVDVPLE